MSGGGESACYSLRNSLDALYCNSAAFSTLNHVVVVVFMACTCACCVLVQWCLCAELMSRFPGLLLVSHLTIY